MVGYLDKMYQISKIANLIIDQYSNSPIYRLANLKDSIQYRVSSIKYQVKKKKENKLISQLTN